MTGVQTCALPIYGEFEVIFLDDASTDNSREVFASFAGDPRIRAVFNEVNSGSPFVQWNRGVRLATGSYIWIAESDDFADSRFLEHMVAALDAHPGVGLAYCQSLLLNEVDQPVGSAEKWSDHLAPGRWQADFVNAGLDECGRYLIHRNTIPNASAVVFRKDKFIEAGWAEESMRLCGDWMTWARILFCSDVAFVARPLNCFRRHEIGRAHV